jgi:hypothetical protein
MVVKEMAVTTRESAPSTSDKNTNCVHDVASEGARGRGLDSWHTTHRSEAERTIGAHVQSGEPTRRRCTHHHIISGLAHHGFSSRRGSGDRAGAVVRKHGKEMGYQCGNIRLGFVPQSGRNRFHKSKNARKRCGPELAEKGENARQPWTNVSLHEADKLRKLLKHGLAKNVTCIGG